MRGIASLACFMAFGSACGPMQSNGAHTEGAPRDDVAYYERFVSGDATTDQSAGAPGDYSTLIGTDAEVDADVPDRAFTATIARRAIASGASLYVVFNQCYSGGFLDDLAALGGTQSVMTAARHTELASYGYEAPSGVNLDSTDTFILAMGDGTKTAEATARQAVALNPFGPNPNAARIGEEQGSEHAQYMSLGGGDTLTLAAHARDGIAVLWAGQPAERDGAQMSRMIDSLVAMGYARDRVWMLYGGGEADADHPVVKAHMKAERDSIHLLAATRANLESLFQRTFAGDGHEPPFLFLYVGDHGGLNTDAIAKRGFKHGDPLVTPTLRKDAGRRIFGRKRI